MKRILLRGLTWQTPTNGWAGWMGILRFIICAASRVSN